MKKKSELSLKKKNLEEQRVDTQKMEKKNVKISLSLSLSHTHTHTHTHTTHMQSFLCTGKGEKYKKFQGHRKTTRTKTKKNLGICTLDNLPDKLFCLVLEERKKERRYLLGMGFYCLHKTEFFLQ
jgi:hypothetical protein